MLFYHGTTDEAAIDILGYNKFAPSTGEHHLLGKGIYFYTDPVQALVWAKMRCNRLNRERAEEAEERGLAFYEVSPTVIEVDIEINEDEFADFDLRVPQNLFFKHRDGYYRSVRKKLLNIDYYTDSHFCDLICDKISVKMLAKTFVYIHPADAQIPVRYSNDRESRDVTKHFRSERQYCLKDDTWITPGSFKSWEEGDAS